MSETAIEHAYTHIRDGIFSGKYPPGFHLREEELADVLEVSRTPVRQAIRLLNSEGFVDIKDNRRSYVTDVGDEELDVIFDLVAMLETYSARRAARRLTPGQLDELIEIENKLEALDVHDDRGFLDANASFHDLIHEAAGSRLLKGLIDQIIRYPVLFYLKAGMHTENETASREHRDIIEALQTGSPDFVGVRMQAHIETVRQQYKSILRGREEK